MDSLIFSIILIIVYISIFVEEAPTSNSNQPLIWWLSDDVPKHSEDNDRTVGVFTTASLCLISCQEECSMEWISYPLLK